MKAVMLEGVGTETLGSLPGLACESDSVFGREEEKDDTFL